MKYTVLAVGRIRPPFADDLEHYGKLLAGQARVELVEVREDADVERRIPPRSYRVLLDVRGRTLRLARRSRAGWRSGAGAGATSASSSAAPTGPRWSAATSGSRSAR